MSIKDFLGQIPNSVSGDGKTFVALLKKFLVQFESVTDEKLSNMSVGGAEQLIGLSLTETHSTDANGMPQNNIVVEFDTTNVTDFSTAQIWLSSDEGKSFQQVGTTGGLKYVVEKVTAGVTYIVKVVAVNTSGGSSDKNKAPQASITIKGSVLIPDMPKQFVLTWDNEGPLWEWLHEDNGYVDFFELRLDANAGEYSDKLLDRVRDFKSRANPNVRSGTAYLFVRNIFGSYSLPAAHQFGKEIGAKPSVPVLSALLSGVNIKMDPLPIGYTGYSLIINGDDFTSKNNEFVYFLISGTITVKYCFVDDIGNGEYSDEVAADVKKLIEAGEIAAGAVGETQLSDDAVTGVKIAADAVTGVKIAADAVSEAKIALNAVTSTKIANSAITDVKIAANAVTEAKVALNAITTTKISDDAVTSGKILAGAVITDKIAANAIVAGKIATDAITADKIIANAITAGKIATDAVTSDKILAGSIVAGKIATDAVTADKILAGSITALKIATDAVTSDKILANAIVADKIATNAITAAKIEANAVEADKIKAGAVTADKIEAGAVTAEKIAADAVTADAIQAGSIIGDHISAGAVTTAKLAAADIDLLGRLAIVGGAVRLDENGLTIMETSGAKTVFDANGITFNTASGLASGAIRKAVCGIANDGAFIHFTEPWSSQPFVIVAPREAQTTVAGYSNSSVKTVCEAYSNDITNDPQMLTGFRVKMKSYLIAGSGGGSSLSGYDIDADGTISPNSPAATTQLTATITVNLGSYVAAHEEVDNTIIHRAYTNVQNGAGWYADRNDYIIGAISFTNGRYFATNGGTLQETKSGTAWTANDNANGMTHNMATTASHTHRLYGAYYNPKTDSLKNLYFNRSFTHRHVKTVAAVSTAGSATISLYYKLSTDSTWTYARSVTYNNTPSGTPTNQSYAVTVVTGLTPGVYAIKAVLTSSNHLNSCQLTAFGADSSGSELDNTEGTVNFLAIETDQNNYYTIE